jgi:hypothetical protein
MNDLNDLSELLFEVARPSMFRANAFRLTGLPVHATERDIRKRLEKVQMLEHYGGPETVLGAGPLPLDPPPENDAVREAAQRLRDPLQRILDEFFWFWPLERGAKDEDPAIAALARRDIEAAVTSLTERGQNSADPGIAAHNLAVMFHTLALDIEHAWQPRNSSRKLRKLQDDYWREGLFHWRAALTSDALWRELEERVREVNDPRLPPEIISQMKATLPLVVLLVNAQLSVRAAERGAIKDAERQRLFMDESGFDDSLIAEACSHTAQQLREQVRTLCERVESELKSAPAEAAELARTLLEKARPPLMAIDVLLSAGDQLREDAHDELATTATNCLYALCNEEAVNWKVALELLDMTRPYAASSAVRGRIDELRIFLLQSAYQ